MIEEIITNIIRCDGLNCHAVYQDCVPMDPNEIATCAKRDGWVPEDVHDTAQLWLCPTCRAVAIQEHCRNKEIADLRKQALRDEKQIARLLQGKFKKGELDELATNLPPDDLTLALLQARRAVADREGDAP